MDWHRISKIILIKEPTSMIQLPQILSKISTKIIILPQNNRALNQLYYMKTPTLIYIRVGKFDNTQSIC